MGIFKASQKRREGQPMLFHSLSTLVRYFFVDLKQNVHKNEWGGGLPSLNYFFTNYIKCTGLCMPSGVGDESLEADSRQLLQQQQVK